MKIQFELGGITYGANFDKPISISIPLRRDDNPGCYYTEPVEIVAVKSEGFVGSVKEGGAVNHMRISLAPHGNGTHTECSGHIFDNNLTIEEVLEAGHFPAQVVSLTPKPYADGLAITGEQITQIQFSDKVRALVIRGLPNDKDKLSRNYSGTNPPFISPEAMQAIVEYKIEHLIVDFPSVDPEIDGGRLRAHKLFWSDTYREKHCTITELAYVPNEVADGLYLLNLQVLRIALDASPANPVLYALKTI